MALLEIEELRAGYGRIEVLHGISLRLEATKLCAIVGANGAGKTTLLLALSRLLPIRSGRVAFDGRDITRASSQEAVKLGLLHVPEGRRMLADMSVEENLKVAAETRLGKAAPADLDATYERFPILGERRTLAAGSLSGGEQQMLAFARALIAKPKALLLDEPSMGLAPKLVERVFEIIAAERARGTSILLVEQNARKALALADYAYVLERGTIRLEGTGKELLHHEEITAAYLGEAADANSTTDPANP
jgi:branched-chain amino acid transport system ATP-binding protein